MFVMLRLFGHGDEKCANCQWKSILYSVDSQQKVNKQLRVCCNNMELSMTVQVEATMLVAPEANHRDLLFFETNPLRLQIRRYLYDIKGFKHPRAYTSADDEALAKFEAVANPGASALLVLCSVLVLCSELVLQRLAGAVKCCCC